MFTEEYDAIFQHKLLPKLKDSGSFTIPYNSGNLYTNKALYDLEASTDAFVFFQETRFGRRKSHYSFTVVGW